MKTKPIGLGGAAVYTTTLTLLLALGAPSAARADETHAKSLLKAMSDYLVAQQMISFGYDTNLEVVTKDQQKILFASSGTAALSRPDKIRATRDGGFASVEMIFDGKTLTLLGKDARLSSYTTFVSSPGAASIGLRSTATWLTLPKA